MPVTVIDRFANESGEPDTDLPATRMHVAFEQTDAGSRLTCTSRFDSLPQLEQLIGMGMLEGTTEAMSQIDAVLADLGASSADLIETQYLSETQVRVARVIRGSREQVWRAHTDADLLRQWLLGPGGWSMPLCEIARNVGDSYRYVWAPDAAAGDAAGPDAADVDAGFGFTGVLLVNEPPYRAVTTEAMIGMDFPATLNELTLTPVEGGTLLSLVITYADREQRDTILATGMTTGMETSYARLETLLATPVAT